MDTKKCSLIAKQMENGNNNDKLIKLGGTKLDQVKWHSTERSDCANWVNRMSRVDFWINIDEEFTKDVASKKPLFCIT